MNLNTSLHSIKAVLILDNEGNRLYAKYYKGVFSADNNSRIENDRKITDKFETLEKQKSFEKELFTRINKIHQDVVLYDNQLVTYKQVNNVIIVIIANNNENECLLFSVVSSIFEVLNSLLENYIDKSAILQKYDIICLIIDEVVDNGIIIETNTDVIISRITNTLYLSHDLNLNLDISEKSIFNVLSFASKKIGEKLQQNL